MGRWVRSACGFTPDGNRPVQRRKSSGECNMAAAVDTPETSRACEPNVVYIGEGVTFKGELAAPELVVIDGTVEGEVRARCARVGATGTLKGSVVVTDADIQGSVSDKLEVKQLLIVRSTGHIEAEISYGELQIEKGAIISGALS